MKFIALFSILASCLLVSCQPPADQQVSFNPKHWKLVKKTPPVYYPVDTPTDQKTTHGNGFWVYSGDAKNTQYFIPFNKTNVPNKTLLAEAQSTKTEALRAQYKSEDIKDKATTIGRGAARVLFELAAGLPPNIGRSPTKKRKHKSVDNKDKAADIVR